MLKKLFLSAAFALFPLTVLTQDTDRIAQITSTIAHIADAKKDIMLEAQTALMLSQRAEKHFQEIFQDTYESATQTCLHALGAIANSSEFTTTLEQVTDEQTILIIEQMAQYNDLLIDPSAYPLEQKVKNVISVAAFDDKQEQLFNVYYVVYAIINGTKMLITKLEVKEKELIGELAALQATNQA